jgi:hypothetical protein
MRKFATSLMTDEQVDALHWSYSCGDNSIMKNLRTADDVRKIFDITVSSAFEKFFHICTGVVANKMQGTILHNSIGTMLIRSYSRKLLPTDAVILTFVDDRKECNTVNIPYGYCLKAYIYEGTNLSKPFYIEIETIKFEREGREFEKVTNIHFLDESRAARTTICPCANILTALSNTFKTDMIDLLGKSAAISGTADSWQFVGDVKGLLPDTDILKARIEQYENTLKEIEPLFHI